MLLRSLSLFVVVTVPLASCGEEAVEQIDNQAPTAVAVAPATASRGQALTVSGATSTDEDGDIVSFAWDFGDGTTGSGATAQHVYNAAGSFTVTLIVTDDDGATDDAVAQVAVDDNSAPTAVIAAPATGSVGQSLRFDGTGSSDVDGSLATFSWNFDDSTTGTGPTFDKVFDVAGTWVVELTVADDRGAKGSAEHTIVIDDAPVSFDGEWTWFLTDETLRDLGFFCGGSFQDSELTIAVTAPSISVTEHAGNQSVAYTGTLTGQAFAVSNVQFTVTQEIVGTFTSSTEFSGFYKIDAGGSSDCQDRPVSGIKQ